MYTFFVCLVQLSPVHSACEYIYKLLVAVINAASRFIITHKFDRLAWRIFAWRLDLWPGASWLNSLCTATASLRMREMAAEFRRIHLLLWCASFSTFLPSPFSPRYWKVISSYRFLFSPGSVRVTVNAVVQLLLSLCLVPFRQVADAELRMPSFCDDVWTLRIAVRMRVAMAAILTCPIIRGAWCPVTIARSKSGLLMCYRRTAIVCSMQSTDQSHASVDAKDLIIAWKFARWLKKIGTHSCTEINGDSRTYWATRRHCLCSVSVV